MPILDRAVGRDDHTHSVEHLVVTSESSVLVHIAAITMKTRKVNVDEYVQATDQVAK